MGLNSIATAIMGIALMVLLAGSAVSLPLADAQTSNRLTVNAYSTSGGSPLSMWATIQSGGTTIKSGFTPLTITGTSGATYIVTVGNYGSYAFDHWGNGSTGNPRWVTLYGDTTATAYYRTGSTTTSPTTSPTSIQTLIPKTGAFVALYMYPGSTGDDHWQKVYDVKRAHPSVPIVAVFNPSSGPGWSDNSVISSWVDKLQSVGIIMLGYTHDDYGSRSLSSLRGDVDKYKNWYNADGVFIDEFTNKVGYESHYRDVTNYAKSIGMKMTMGNPGTDVPRSYIGTVDVINITEGSGYMPLSWLQFCVLCSGSGWHDDYDKRNFSYIRYDISWLDTWFVNNSANWVGLMYLTNGDDSNSRWFAVPHYFDEMVAELD